MDDRMMEIFFEIHDGLEREGPGSDQHTAKAFSLLPEIAQGTKLLDIGCGPGSQTLQLATLLKSIGGHVTAVDYYQKYLDQLRRRMGDLPITTLQGDMNDLPFKSGTFDIIWSEGAIYIMGFEKGLKAWRKLLKPGGYMAVTEISWLRRDIPKTPKDFWDAAYPAMNTVDENIRLAQDVGYEVLDHFTLPVSAWFDQYYAPIEAKLQTLRIKYEGDAEALGVLDNEHVEIDLYRKYSNYYGYEFYLLKKSA